MESATLDKIHTAEEAADRLRLTTRGVIKLAKKHGQCSRRGRDYLFSEADLLAIWQVLREPAAQPGLRGEIPKLIRSPIQIHDNLRWILGRPPVRCDRREIRILFWLSQQKTEKTSKQINRAGPKTIDSLLQRGFLTAHGTDRDGLALVKISPPGRDQLKIVERWMQKHAARGTPTSQWLCNP